VRQPRCRLVQIQFIHSGGKGSEGADVARLMGLS
jgi:hypothetical protein